MGNFETPELENKLGFGELITTENHEPVSPLCNCPECSSDLMYPHTWGEFDDEEAVDGRWWVQRHCPNCDLLETGVFTQEQVDSYDISLDDGQELLQRSFEWIRRHRFEEQVESFAAAIKNDQVLPEDF